MSFHDGQVWKKDHFITELSTIHYRMVVDRHSC